MNFPFLDFESSFFTDEELLFLAGASGGRVEHTIINNPATFTTDLAKPLRRLVIPFTPVQSGTGDPSPSNIRPITGWTGLNINRTGINAFDGVLEQGAINGNGGDTPSTSNYRSKNFIPVIPGASYRAVFNIAGGGSNMRVFYYFKDKTCKRDAWTSPANTIIIDADVYFVRFYMDTAWSEATDRTIGFNYSATATEFEPYSGTTIPVSWQTETGTVYGGTLDALTGVLTVTHGIWTANTSTMNRTTPDFPGWNDCGIDAIVGTGISKTYYNGYDCALSFGSAMSVDTRSGYANVTLSYSVYGLTQEEWIELALDVQFVAELAEPFTVQLDPVTLSTLIGENVVWTDTNGDNTIVYLKKT